jgi:hypothetical protein
MKQRIPITLPTGGTLIVRPPSVLEGIELGAAPASLRDWQARKARHEAEQAVPFEEPPPPAAVEYLVKSFRLTLVRCTGPITWPGQRPVKLVEKPFHECSDAELSIEEMDDRDAAAIQTAVARLAEEGAARAAKFRAEQPPETTARAGHRGEALRHAPDEAAATAAVANGDQPPGG